MKAIRVHEFGGPEVLRYEDLPTPEPGQGEVLVKIAAAGINYIDIYHRIGLYPLSLPSPWDWKRRASSRRWGQGWRSSNWGTPWPSLPTGRVCRVHCCTCGQTCTRPPELDLNSAAAALLQGMTAHFLTHSTYPLKAGDVVLIHAAAGGVGLLLVQMAKRLGATVIGTTSTEEKAHSVREAGPTMLFSTLKPILRRKLNA